MQRQRVKLIYFTVTRRGLLLALLWSNASNFAINNIIIIIIIVVMVITFRTNTLKTILQAKCI